MGDIRGFLKHDRASADPPRPCRCGSRTGTRSTSRSRRRQLRDPGQPLHGLRHPVLQQRLPARQPHPRLERPRLPRPVARGHRPAARHQQLPRVHRPALPGAVRGGVRARHQPADPVTIKQVEVEIIDRAWAEGWVDAGARRRCRTGKRVAVVGSGPGRAGRRPAAHPGRPRRRRLRAGRPHRRPAALRHPRVQDGEAAPRPPPRRRWRPRAPSSAPASTSASTSPPTSCAADFDAVVLAGGATAGPRPADPRPRARRHPPGDGVTCRSPTGCRRATSTDTAHHRRRQARRHHRRRRHRRRLPRHRRTARARPRSTSSRSCPARPTSAADDHPVAARGRLIFRVSVGARGGRRAGVRGQHRAVRRRRTAASPRCGPTRCESEVVDGRPTFVKVEGTRVRAARATSCCWPWASSAPSARRCSSSSASSSTAGATWPATTAGAPTCRGVFVAGDMGRGQSLIVWAIAEGRARRRRGRRLPDGRDRPARRPCAPPTAPSPEHPRPPPLFSMSESEVRTAHLRNSDICKRDGTGCRSAVDDHRAPRGKRLAEQVGGRDDSSFSWDQSMRIVSQPSASSCRS